MATQLAKDPSKASEPMAARRTRMRLEHRKPLCVNRRWKPSEMPRAAARYKPSSTSASYGVGYDHTYPNTSTARTGSPATTRVVAAMAVRFVGAGEP